MNPRLSYSVVYASMMVGTTWTKDRTLGGAFLTDDRACCRRFASASPMGVAVSPDEVRAFRQRAIENGYRPLTVRSGSKEPLTRNWQYGEDPVALLDVRPEGTNTGLLLAGFRCIDSDVDDPELALEIIRAARQHFPPGALIRRRANSPRCALLYRAADGQPSKRVANGPKGKVEILGLGQQAVVHGLHPTGAAITWQKGRGPDAVPHDQVPVVSEDQITAFCTRVRRCSAPEFLNPRSTAPRQAAQALPVFLAQICRPRSTISKALSWKTTWAPESNRATGSASCRRRRSPSW